MKRSLSRAMAGWIPVWTGPGKTYMVPPPGAGFWSRRMPRCWKREAILATAAWALAWSVGLTRRAKSGLGPVVGGPMAPT